MWYVTMIDTFMSGWGPAKGKQNLLVFECENEMEANNVARYARSRNDQTDIKIYSANQDLPDYNPKKFYVQTITKEDYPMWYEDIL